MRDSLLGASLGEWIRVAKRIADSRGDAEAGARKDCGTSDGNGVQDTDGRPREPGNNEDLDTKSAGNHGGHHA